MIRTSTHSIKFCNNKKQRQILEFLQEYRRVSILFLNEIWENGIDDFIPSKDALDKCPKFFNYKKLNFETNLSARVLRTLTGQVLDILRGCVKKRKNVLFLIKNGKITEDNKLKYLNKYKLSKPDVSNINPRLNSLCCDIQVGKSFDLFVALKSLGKKYGKIKIPIKETKVSLKWLKRGSRMSVIEIRETNLCFCYDIQNYASDTKGKIVGIDQGLKTVATLSDHQTTPTYDIHNHSFESICEKLSQKKMGSKSFRKAQSHRKNFINWSLNQIDWSNIGEIRLEKIWNINYKKRAPSRKLKHFTNTLIRDKIQRIAEEMKVLFVLQGSSYRSQRCCNCGIVRKANRKGKVYSCKHCKNTIDADLNAAKNHETTLPDIHWTFRGQKLNLGNGFFWKQNGLFNFDGSELIVPNSKTINI